MSRNARQAPAAHIEDDVSKLIVPATKLELQHRPKLAAPA
jgi:hypothetical protein